MAWAWAAIVAVAAGGGRTVVAGGWLWGAAHNPQPCVPLALLLWTALGTSRLGRRAVATGLLVESWVLGPPSPRLCCLRQAIAECLGLLPHQWTARPVCIGAPQWTGGSLPWLPPVRRSTRPASEGASPTPSAHLSRRYHLRLQPSHRPVVWFGSLSARASLDTTPLQRFQAFSLPGHCLAVKQELFTGGRGTLRAGSSCATKSPSPSTHLPAPTAMSGCPFGGKSSGHGAEGTSPRPLHEVRLSAPARRADAAARRQLPAGPSTSNEVGVS